MVNGMHQVTPGQKKAWVFGMNGGRYGMQTPYAKGLYCAQIFQGGDTIATQWPIFNATHRGMNFTASNAPFTSCGAAAAHYNGTAEQVVNPVVQSVANGPYS